MKAAKLQRAQARIAKLESDNALQEEIATRDRHEAITLAGGMNFQTMSAIANALHSDRKPNEAEREKAFKLFTAWKADKNKAQRRGR
jgi:hypothetical protein